MSKNRGMVVLSILTAALAIANGVVFISEDRTGPRIQFSGTERTYSENERESELLEGVKAIDDRDGDVTDSLRISSVIANEEESEVTVEYVAKDHSNNVTKVSRTFSYR